MTDEDDFYAALGRAITSWSAVELNVYKIYHEIMKPQLWVVTSTTYHVAQIFRQKLAVVDAAIQSGYNDENYYAHLHKEWETLKKRINRNGTKRNDIAHLAVFNDLEKGLCLRPELMNAKAMLDEAYKSKIYWINDLKQCISDFSDLASTIQSFVDRLPPPPLSPQRRSHPK